MKLSRSAWNNVIIYSVMAMILLINLTNDRLFPDNSEIITNNDGIQAIVGIGSVILTLSIDDKLLIERFGQSWHSTPNLLSQHNVDQLMQAWQNVSGLPQASTIEIKGLIGTKITINTASSNSAQVLNLFALTDQLLIEDQSNRQWFSLPLPMYQQLIPLNL